MTNQPIIAEARLVCSQCGKRVKVVGVETHPEDKRGELLTFECAGGHIITAAFPE